MLVNHTRFVLKEENFSTLGRAGAQIAFAITYFFSHRNVSFFRFHTFQMPTVHCVQEFVTAELKESFVDVFNDDMH